MAFGAYDTRTLLRVIEEKLDRPKTFLLDTFFPTIQTFDTESIDFDVLNVKAKLAPFVHPDATARPVRTGGYVTKTFKPAYIKELEAISPNRAFKRRAGERYMGDMSPEARLDAAVTDSLDAQRRSILRRKEWMAAQAIRFGSVTVSGPDFPPMVVDYGRHTDLTVTLLSGARWGETGVDPLDDIETWSETVQTHCGVAGTQIVFGPAAWKLARKSERLLELLDIRRQPSGNIELGPVTVDNTITGARYLGSIGELDFWVYQQTYEADNGSTAKFLDDYNVIVGSTYVEGVQAHGAIQDVEMLRPVEIFPDVYAEKNPSRLFAKSESAPLVVPTRVNAMLCAKVR
jgi:hypothetical protein